jgi:hypothetical protein
MVTVDYALDRVRITHIEQPKLTLEELRSRVEGLENLMMLLAEPDYIANNLIYRSDRYSHGPASIDELREWAGEQSILQRVHYNPVLEIILVASAGVTALLALWRQYSHSRREASRADIQQDEAEVSHARSRADIQRAELDSEIAQELRARWQHLVEGSLVDPVDGGILDRMLLSAVREVLTIESVGALAEGEMGMES